MGATIFLNRIVHRRRAGLPLAAALVNMVAATRPEGMPGLQSCYIVKNLTFRSTRSAVPLVYGDAVHMVDYRTTTTPDRCARGDGVLQGLGVAAFALGREHQTACSE